jgi:hypothetical protein
MRMGWHTSEDKLHLCLQHVIQQPIGGIPLAILNAGYQAAMPGGAKTA